MVFFFDACLSPHYARMIAEFDRAHCIRHVFESGGFHRDDTDAVIVGKLSQEVPKPVFITSDVNMVCRNPNERKVLRESGLTCVFFKKGFSELGLEEQAWKLVRVWPLIVKEAGGCRQPTAFEIGPRALKVEFYRLTKDL